MARAFMRAASRLTWCGPAASHWRQTGAAIRRPAASNTSSVTRPASGMAKPSSARARIGFGQLASVSRGAGAGAGATLTVPGTKRSDVR